MLDKSSEKYLYEQVADYIQDLIKQKTLQSGDRLPSLRKLQKQVSVSVSTVIEAYRLLEDRGLITVRPQSGYYVKTAIRDAPLPGASLAVKANIISEEPNLSAPPQQANVIDTSTVFRVYTDIARPQIVKLGAAVPSPELLPLVTLNRIMGQVIRSNPEKIHPYQFPNGCEMLRHEIAKRLIDAGCAIPPHQIMVTNGSTEAIYLALRVVTQPGDTVAIESPCYYGLLQTLESLNLKALELPTDPREGISLEHLEAAFKTSKISACVLVSNFSNPLGSSMSNSNKQDLVELITKYNIPLVEDDIYGDLHFEGNRPKAIKAFDREGLVLYCSSVSKTLSPGLRIGWLVAEKYFLQVKKLKIVTNIMTAIVPQLTVAHFFSNGGYERHLRKMRHVYQSQMEKMRLAISNYFPPQTKITRPQGGQVLWLELPENFDVMQLYESALEYHISIAPGIIFSPSKSYANCLRLNCGLLWSEEIEKALQILGALAQQQLANKILGT